MLKFRKDLFTGNMLEIIFLYDVSYLSIDDVLNFYFYAKTIQLSTFALMEN